MTTDADHCPRCHGTQSGCIDSRGMTRYGRRRRRLCPACGWRWSTIEVNAQTLETLVQNRDALGRIAKTMHNAQAEISGLVAVIDAVLAATPPPADLALPEASE